MANAKVASDALSAPITQLLAQKERVDLGDSALVYFNTDEQGVGRVDLSLVKEGAQPSSTAPISLMHSMGAHKVSWSGSQIYMSGLRPSAGYKMEVALWLWGQARSHSDDTKGEGPFKAFTDKPSSVPDCAQRCVAALGNPALVSLKTGPAWERVEIDALSKTPWMSPMLLALLGLCWRSGAGPIVRKALVASGMETVLPMMVGASKIK
jgi:hypothetical protein